ncbi:MAG: glycosyltransferase, partial [Alphaproteobacteria bacterium GM202ARS2]|nr:glycosyltransferase [Alphaproteobacteria bacterium GM202ARS2]
MTQEKNRLSCYVITLNEAQRLPLTLMSVKGVADDLVVVDSGSTDGTQAIARAYGARVIQHSFDGFGKQKHFAESQCRHDWLLNLDADEWLTEGLKREIVRLFSKGEPKRFFYELRRIDTIYPFRERSRLWVNCHRRVRLYHRRYGRHSLDKVHEHVDVGRHSVGRLRHRIMHRSVRDFHSLMGKLNSYSSYQAPQGSKRFYSVLRLRLFTEPLTAFLRAYVRDRHITGGLWGFAYSVMESCHHFTRVVKMVEHREGWAKVPKMPIKSLKLKVPLRISCCIIARNEADRIVWPLRSLCGFVDDIVVVDGGSTDDTVAVARSYGARVVKRAWQGYG